MEFEVSELLYLFWYIADILIDPKIIESIEKDCNS